MKRRVLSFITVMALCVNLIPVQAFAVDGEGGGLCPHHQAHTEECGYVLPVPGQECAHVHEDGCYTEDTDCIHGHTAECYLNPEDGSETEGPDFCAHACTEDGGCVTRTLDCPHEHDEECGYAPEIPGAPCAFVCKICPIDELIGGLPGRVTAANRERVEAQLREIYELYDGLTGDEQEQVDLSRCDSLREQLDKANAGIQTIADPYKVVFEADGDTEFPSTLEVEGPGSRVNTMGYTVTCASGTVLRVTGTGELDL
ncbi:MAG: hypothetical protein K2K53_11710, partial [Oscillospiraceae bacterium]|nr:hypothetical protein [Oscillospiraceae bacterium]